MSVIKIYAVYDSAVGAHMHPMFFQSRGQAVRAWLDACVDPNTQFSKHPADFTLFEIASYDEETGQFENLPAKINLGTALELTSQTIKAVGGLSAEKSSEIKKTTTIQGGSAQPSDPTALKAKLAVEKHSERNMQ